MNSLVSKTAVSKTDITRRTCLGLALISTLVSTGCAVAPSSGNNSPKATRQAALRSLGFAETVDGWELNLAARAMFAVNDATLTPDDLAALTGVAQVLLDVGIDRLTVEGHTDNQGGDEQNRLLADRRAKAVADVLVAKGFAPGSITRHGFGASRPIADNATETGRLRNRRAVLIVPSL
jgi:outer membrane protein OmpA-like peptidoglycan-associated protein